MPRTEKNDQLTFMQVLDVTGVQQAYGVGKHLARALMKKVPHAKVGKSLRVRRTDMDSLINKAIDNEEDLWDVARA